MRQRCSQAAHSRPDAAAAHRLLSRRAPVRVRVLADLHHAPVPRGINEMQRIVDAELQHALGNIDGIVGGEEVNAFARDGEGEHVPMEMGGEPDHDDGGVPRPSSLHQLLGGRIEIPIR